MRVLQAPINIANQAWLNAQALRLRGHEAEVWQFGESKFGYPADRVFLETHEPRAVVRTLVEAIGREFDVVHFHFARSLVPAAAPLPWLWDLPLWKALGVRVVFSFHGSDIRIPSVAKQLDRWSAYHFTDIPCDENQIEDLLAIIRSYADGFTISNVADRPHLPDAVYLPLSIDLREIPESPWQPGCVPVVAHAPSARGTKGTEFVLAGLEALRKQGVEFEVDLIEGVSNREVLERYARADVVVEKLVNQGFGVSALEAMAVGRPVISRVVPLVYEEHPTLPIVSADPETFVDVLGKLLGDRAEMARRGAAGRPYVRENHDIERTGKRLEALYSRPPAPAEQIYPGWTVPLRDRRISQLQARVHELRTELSRWSKQAEEMPAALERATEERCQLEHERDALRGANLLLERKLEEARHSPKYRLARLLRKAAVRTHRRP